MENSFNKPPENPADKPEVRAEMIRIIEQELDDAKRALNSIDERLANLAENSEQGFERSELVDKRAEYTKKITDKEHLLDQLANHTPDNNHE